MQAQLAFRRLNYIRNPAAVAKFVDFTSLLDIAGIQGAVPTDIDGFLEIRDKHFVFFEIKSNGAKMPTGQRLALERLARRIGSGEAKAIVILADDNNPEREGPAIPVEECEVRAFLLSPSPANDWIVGQGQVRALVEDFLQDAVGLHGNELAVEMPLAAYKGS